MVATPQIRVPVVTKDSTPSSGGAMTKEYFDTINSKYYSIFGRGMPGEVADRLKNDRGYADQFYGQLVYGNRDSWLNSDPTTRQKYINWGFISSTDADKYDLEKQQKEAEDKSKQEQPTLETVYGDTAVTPTPTPTVTDRKTELGNEIKSAFDNKIITEDQYNRFMAGVNSGLYDTVQTNFNTAVNDYYNPPTTKPAEITDATQAPTYKFEMPEEWKTIETYATKRLEAGRPELTTEKVQKQAEILDPLYAKSKEALTKKQRDEWGYLFSRGGGTGKQLEENISAFADLDMDKLSKAIEYAKVTNAEELNDFKLAQQMMTDIGQFKANADKFTSEQEASNYWNTMTQNWDNYYKQEQLKLAKAESALQGEQFDWQKYLQGSELSLQEKQISNQQKEYIANLANQWKNLLTQRGWDVQDALTSKKWADEAWYRQSNLAKELEQLSKPEEQSLFNKFIGAAATGVGTALGGPIGGAIGGTVAKALT